MRDRTFLFGDQALKTRAINVYLLWLGHKNQELEVWRFAPHL
jgi:hypothetical protein